MATITLNIPNAIVNRVLDAITAKYGYTGYLPDGVTAQTKAEFVKAWMISTVKSAVKEHESNTASAAAFISAGNDVENNIIIT